MGLSNDGILTAPFTKIAANGQGDLQRALGSALMNQVSLMTVPEPNKWAKYQPFVSGDIYTDRYTDTNSKRLAGLKAANWGWEYGGIPSYANWSVLQSVLGSVTPGRVWTRARPTASNILRAMDYDGYATTEKCVSEWGGLGQSGNMYLYFPFGGLISLFRNDYVVYTDTLDIMMDGYDPDVDSTGLLYLSDFAAMSAVNPSYYNYIDWYLAVLLVPQGTSPATGYLANTANTIAEFTEYNTPAIQGLPFYYGGGQAEFTEGNYYLYPCLCSRNFSAGRFAQIHSGWGNENQGPGRVVLLDGYRLPVKINKANTSPERVSLTVWYDFSVSGSTTTITVHVRNITNSAITVYNNQFFCYVVAGKAYDDQYSDYLTYVHNAAEAWVGNGSTDYMSDRKNASGVVLGKYFNLYSLFVAANGNSNVLAANSAEKTFTVTINSATDAQGFPYNQWGNVDLMYGYALAGQSYQRRHQ